MHGQSDGRGRIDMKMIKGRRAYYPGEIVFREGEPGDVIYLVERGLVEIWRGSPTSKIVLGTIPAGGIFGEMAIFDGGPRVANATILEEAVLVVVASDRVRDALNKADPILKLLIRVMLDSTRRTAAQFEEAILALEASTTGTDPGV